MHIHITTFLFIVCSTRNLKGTAACCSDRSLLTLTSKILRLKTDGGGGREGGGGGGGEGTKGGGAVFHGVGTVHC
jgi:hypothetical protein